MESSRQCGAMSLTRRDPVGGACDAGPDLKALFSELVRLETELWNAVESRLRSEHGIPLPFFEFMRVISGRPRCAG